MKHTMKNKISQCCRTARNPLTLREGCRYVTSGDIPVCRSNKQLKWSVNPPPGVK